MSYAMQYVSEAHKRECRKIGGERAVSRKICLAKAVCAAEFVARIQIGLRALANQIWIDIRFSCKNLLMLTLMFSAGPAMPADTETKEASTVSAAITGEALVKVRVSLLAPPSSIELPGNYRILFRVSNLTTDKYKLSSFNLVPFYTISGFIGPKACASPDLIIDAGEDALVPCDIGGFGNFDFPLLTIQPGTYNAHATAILMPQVDGQYAGFTSVSTIVELQVRPSVWQVVAGALFGSLMLAIFVRLSPITRFRTADAGKSTILLWVSAFVASAMFILLTYRLKDSGSPITITVNDFYGGVAIGMFGILLADWLSERLFSTTSGGNSKETSNGGQPRLPTPNDGEPAHLAAGRDSPEAANLQPAYPPVPD